MRTSLKHFKIANLRFLSVLTVICRSTRMSFLPLLFQRCCFAHIIAKSYPIQTVIQLLSTSGFSIPLTCSDREKVDYRVSEKYPLNKQPAKRGKIFDFCENFSKKFLSLNEQAVRRAKICPILKISSKIFSQYLIAHFFRKMAKFFCSHYLIGNFFRLITK